MRSYAQIHDEVVAGLSQLTGADAAGVQTSHGAIASAVSTALSGVLGSRQGTLQATGSSGSTISQLLQKAAQMYEQGDQKGAATLRAAAEALEGSQGAPGSSGTSAEASDAGGTSRAGGGGADMMGTDGAVRHTAAAGVSPRAATGSTTGHAGRAADRPTSLTGRRGSGRKSLGESDCRRRDNDQAAAGDSSAGMDPVVAGFWRSPRLAFSGGAAEGRGVRSIVRSGESRQIARVLLCTVSRTWAVAACVPVRPIASGLGDAHESLWVLQRGGGRAAIARSTPRRPQSEFMLGAVPTDAVHAGTVRTQRGIAGCSVSLNLASVTRSVRREGAVEDGLRSRVVG